MCAPQPPLTYRRRHVEAKGRIPARQRVSQVPVRALSFPLPMSRIPSQRPGLPPAREERKGAERVCLFLSSHAPSGLLLRLGLLASQEGAGAIREDPDRCCQGSRQARRGATPEGGCRGGGQGERGASARSSREADDGEYKNRVTSIDLDSPRAVLLASPFAPPSFFASTPAASATVPPRFVVRSESAHRRLCRRRRTSTRWPPTC